MSVLLHASQKDGGLLFDLSQRNSALPTCRYIDGVPGDGEAFLFNSVDGSKQYSNPNSRNFTHRRKAHPRQSSPRYESGDRTQQFQEAPSLLPCDDAFTPLSYS
jgi:hypothetical protein